MIEPTNPFQRSTMDKLSVSLVRFNENLYPLAACKSQWTVISQTHGCIVFHGNECIFDRFRQKDCQNFFPFINHPRVASARGPYAPRRQRDERRVGSFEVSSASREEVSRHRLARLKTSVFSSCITIPPRRRREEGGGGWKRGELMVSVPTQRDID